MGRTEKRGSVINKRRRLVEELRKPHTKSSSHVEITLQIVDKLVLSSQKSLAVALMAQNNGGQIRQRNRN